MKIMKKILSGIMALTMAASMMSATALQAGALVLDGKTHDFQMSGTGALTPDFKVAQLFKLEGIQDSEVEDFKKADAKGFVLFTLKHFFSTGEYLEIKFEYNNGKFTLMNINENGNKLSTGKTTIEWGPTTTYTDLNDLKATSIIVTADIDEAIFKKYKFASLKHWSITSLSDKYEAMPEYCYGSDRPAANSMDYKKGGTSSETTEEVKSNDISTLEISKIKNQTYTGKNRKPAITIKDGDKTLEKGKDYTVSYKNCKKVGIATATIKGKGDYTGEKTIEYKIVPKKTSLKVTKSSDKKATFKWNKVSGAEKYEIYYSTDGGKKYKKLTTVSGSKTSYTSTKLNFKKYDYKFKIRSYGTSGETKCYSSYSSVKTVK